MHANIETAILHIKDFVHNEPPSALWETLCCEGNPCLLDHLGIECNNRHNMSVPIREEFWNEFNDLTVPHRDDSSKEKARWWKECQTNGYWTREKYEKIIAIVRKVANKCC